MRRGNQRRSPHVQAGMSHLVRDAALLLGTCLFFGTAVAADKKAAAAADKKAAAAAADQRAAPPESRCVTLTWPDGRQAKIGDFDQNVRFLEACETTPGKCKLDNAPFPAKDAKGRSPTRVLADAATECVVPVETKPEAGVADKTSQKKGSK